MCLNSVDHRSEQLLLLLMEQDDFVTIGYLAKRLGETNRTIQYHLHKMNGFLQDSGLSPIISRRNKGIFIEPANRPKLLEFFRANKQNIDFVFSPEDRAAIIICENILAHRTETVDEIADRLRVSRNTCLLDIRTVRSTLARYKINLIHDVDGYRFEGDDIRLRSVLMYYISFLYPLISSGMLRYLSGAPVKNFLGRLKRIEVELGVDYRQGTLDKIAVMLHFCRVPLKSEVSFFEGTASGMRVLEAVNRYFAEYSENDRRYVAIQLMSGRVKSAKDINPQENEYYISGAECLVASFEHLIGIPVENRSILVYNLARHLSRSVFRYRYGLVDTCELDGKIQTDSKELFKLVKLASQDLARRLNCPINDSEVSLLTVYFGTHMRKNNLRIGKLHVALITSADDREAGQLKKKLDNGFPMLQVVRTATPEEVPDLTGDFTFLISTQLLQYQGLYVYISNQLTAADRKRILETYLKFRELDNLNICDNLFERIRQYIPRENYSSVREELQGFFRRPMPNLFQLIDRKCIQIFPSASGWRNAIWRAASPLLENGCILESYINSIIVSLEMYGCNVYLGNGVFLAHAQSQKDVRRSGVAVSAFRNSVLFPDGNEIKILIVIASTDRYEHFNVLKEAVRICNEEQKVRKILACDTAEELFRLIETMAGDDA